MMGSPRAAGRHPCRGDIWRTVGGLYPVDVPPTEGDPYPSWPGLHGYYFEDSYVLAITIAPASIDFDLLAVLTPSHPGYRSPVPAEQYCYRDARLSFPEPRRFSLGSPEVVVPAIDADGDRDLGNIDLLTYANGVYRIEGSWGVIEVESEPPTVALTSSGDKEDTERGPSGQRG